MVSVDKRPRCLPAAVALAWLGLIAPGIARAQSDQERMAWEQLVHELKQAIARGDHATAAERGEAALKIRHSPSLRTFVLEEERAAHNPAAAYTNAFMCSSEAQADKTLANRDSILAKCQAAMSELLPAIGHLTIVLKPPVPEQAKVRVNGVEVESLSVLAAPLPENPGDVAVDVVAPGDQPFHKVIAIVAGISTSIDVSLAPVEVQCPEGQLPGPDRQTCVPICGLGKTYTADAQHCCWPGQTWAADQSACSGEPRCPAGLVAMAGDCVAAAAPMPVTAIAPSRPAEGPKRSTASLYVVGSGAALLVGGTIAWAVSNSKYSTLQSDCGPPNACSLDRFNSDASSVKTFDALTAIGWSVGGTAVVGGLLWYFLSGSTPAHETVAWQVDPFARTASVSGVW